MKEFDKEIFEMFIDQIESELPIIKYNISLLRDEKESEEAINTLFRTFHNYKATSSYFSLTNFFNLTVKAEIVLNSFRHTYQLVPNTIIIWLQQVESQILIWLEEMCEHKLNLSPISHRLNKTIKLSKPYISPTEKLKTLTILYLDANKKRNKKIVHFLEKISQKTILISHTDGIKEILQADNYDIIISNMGLNNYTVIDYIRENNLCIPIITAFDSVDNSDYKKLMQKGISHILRNPLNATLLKNELSLVTSSHFSSINITIDNEKIKDFIYTMKPMNNTIMQIIQVCDDDEIPVKALIKVVKVDPVITGKILTLANSPLYGSIRLRTIEQAITRLGKTTIKALALNNIRTSVGEINLKPYNINEDIFAKVSMTRLSLMLKWYSKISISDLSILSSTAILGNIGQILISQELVNINKDDIFQEMIETLGIKYAEESLVYTTTNIISAQILSYWQLSRSIISIIMYSDNPEEAPEDMRKLAVANHIVYALISIDGTIQKTIPDELLDIMAKYDFELNILEKALNAIQNLKD